MIIQNLASQKPFTTADSSTIRSILDLSNAPVKNQSLAEASLPAGTGTTRHYHKLSEEFYFFLSGRALVEVDGEEKEVLKDDCVLIPPGAWHQVTAHEETRFLCCCAPPYAHGDTYFE
ncbi:MAG: cupin domain-containing protein [Chthoniobacterales bacterium]